MKTLLELKYEIDKEKAKEREENRKIIDKFSEEIVKYFLKQEENIYSFCECKKKAGCTISDSVLIYNIEKNYPIIIHRAFPNALKFIQLKDGAKKMLGEPFYEEETEEEFDK